MESGGLAAWRCDGCHEVCVAVCRNSLLSSKSESANDRYSQRHPFGARILSRRKASLFFYSSFFRASPTPVPSSLFPLPTSRHELRSEEISRTPFENLMEECQSAVLRLKPRGLFVERFYSRPQSLFLMEGD